MHKLSTTAAAIGLGFLLAGCGTIGPAQGQDPAIASLKAANLAFETVCMPVVLDGADFLALAKARGMVPMEPAARGTTTSSHAFRVGLTGVAATQWEDGSCVVSAQTGNTEQLQAQTLASLKKRGHAMTLRVSGSPAINNGVGAVYCNPDLLPLILAVTTPASKSTNGHAMIATLYRADTADTCPRANGV